MSASQQIKITHHGTEIVYDEEGNLFRFTLRGRDRSAPSLAKAKEYIDKPVDPKNPEDKPFERVKCYSLGGYTDKYSIVEVTSVADSPSWRTGKDYWTRATVDGKKAQRQKVAEHYLFPVNAVNTPIVETILAKRHQIDVLSAEISALHDKLQQIKI